MIFFNDQDHVIERKLTRWDGCLHGRGSPAATGQLECGKGD
jgi:hypothetical protein